MWSTITVHYLLQFLQLQKECTGKILPSHARILLEGLCGKLSASFSDTLAIPRNPIGCKDMEYDLRAQMMDLEFVVNQGLRLKLKNAPHGLEPSLMCYK
ncbi:hypothetical protein Tco_1060474 [Tanacetum coccineum]